jgi:hypothetical protein
LRRYRGNIVDDVMIVVVPLIGQIFAGHNVVLRKKMEVILSKDAARTPAWKAKRI